MDPNTHSTGPSTSGPAGTPGGLGAIAAELQGLADQPLGGLTDAARAERLRELIGAKCAEHGWTVEALEVLPDHVHLLARCGPDASPARLAHQLKGATSRALRAEFGHLRSRLPTLWSRSYLVASVGRVSEATIRRYVAEQTTRPTKGMP